MRTTPGPATIVVAVVTAVVLSACGTRLPDSAFAPPSTTAPTVTPTVTSPAGGTTTVVANQATDVGVTPDEIRVGMVVSVTSPLGAEAFSAPGYGARAYFDGLNASGGINGRKVKVVFCDDQSSGAGNQECLHKLIEQDKVFAFAGNSIFQYAGAGYVSEQAVPDIGGQPIGSEYDQYQHLYSIYGSSSPRNGVVGFDGKLYGGTEVYRYFKDKMHAKVAAVVAYNQSDSLRYAHYTQDGLEREGYKVVLESVDFGVSNWDAIVLDMRSRGVQIVFDALENTGNVNLCKAMDRNGFQVEAKVVTVQGWTDSVRTDYGDSPQCRNSLYATGNDRNYADTKYKVVEKFRKDMARSYPDRQDKLSMWTLEGWASAQWFADAAASCGAALTRVCVEAYMNRTTPYDGHGLLTPRNFVVSTNPGADSEACLNVAKWSDDAEKGRGGWVTEVKDMNKNCSKVPQIPYTA
ncbi:MAG: ABC transporter substrate-binding protein [Acidimicrobiales bacterium]